jgi:putative acetyltransferase
MKKEITIRLYRSDDIELMISIFLNSIRDVASKDYSKAQIDAWAQVDKSVWGARRASRPTWVAEMDDLIVGWADLEPSGHIDMLYVHPSYQSKGVASELLATIEAEARTQGLQRVFAEASITAKPFFERRGFRLVATQDVEVRGQLFINHRMEKVIK